MGLLNVWEFEWYKAFHVLRDGTSLPGAGALTSPPLNISPAQVRSWIRRLKEMDEELYVRINRRACEEISGQRDPNPNRPVSVDDRMWAQMNKENEIAEIERYLNPKRTPAQSERRVVWESLVRARTLSALKEVCEQWAILPDVRAWGLACYPDHILANAREFFRMKREARFPKSDSPVLDESRMEYLARGMAGILVGVSPMTGIERLRNMKHARGGPLWTKEPGGREYCGCWRCGMDRERPVHKLGAAMWWNGLALFMRLAEAESKIKKAARR
jgi:hypothetical protein